jgi:hypothetical protein
VAGGQGEGASARPLGGLLLVWPSIDSWAGRAAGTAANVQSTAKGRPAPSPPGSRTCRLWPCRKRRALPLSALVRSCSLVSAARELRLMVVSPRPAGAGGEGGGVTGEPRRLLRLHGHASRSRGGAGSNTDSSSSSSSRQRRRRRRQTPAAGRQGQCACRRGVPLSLSSSCSTVQGRTTSTHSPVVRVCALAGPHSACRAAAGFRF